MADEQKGFDPASIKEDGFYRVQLSRSTVLDGTPLAAANAVRLSGRAVKQISDAILSATEIEETEKHDIMRPLEQGVIQVTGSE